MERRVWTPSLGGLQWRADDDPKGRNSTIIVRLELPPNVQGKRDLSVDMRQKRLKIAFTVSKVSGPEVVVDGELARQIIADESTWVIEKEDDTRKRFLTVHLAKKVDQEKWPCLFAEEKSAGLAATSDAASAAAPSAAKPPKQLTPEQQAARDASDLKLLKNNYMAKMELNAQIEVQSLLDRGARPGDIIKMMNQARRGELPAATK